VRALSECVYVILSQDQIKQRYCLKASFTLLRKNKKTRRENSDIDKMQKYFYFRRRKQAAATIKTKQIVKHGRKRELYNDPPPHPHLMDFLRFRGRVKKRDFKKQ